MKILLPLMLTVMITSLYSCGDQLPLTIEVETGPYNRYQSILTLDLAAITSVPQEHLVLFLEKPDGDISVPFQVVSADGRKLMWQLPEFAEAQTRLTYRLERGKSPAAQPGRSVREQEGSFTFTSGGKDVLTYQAATVYPPEGADEAFKRSGFVHPLYAPSGAILTEIQPADHIHHYGIWNPWTRTTFREEIVDFWNLRKREGTVQHAGVQRIIEGSVMAQMEHLHHHVAWPGSERQTNAMDERHIIRSYRRDDGRFWIDFEFHITPRENITLEEYRYGGFVFRGTAGWTNTTSDFVTSEGLDRDAADGQRARWCIVTGDTPQGRAGILFMGNPANFNHPEPLRVWPSDGNGGRGDVFINFSPTRNTAWSLQAGETYVLNYRLLVFDGTMDVQTAARLWDDYANPPVVRVK